MEPPCVRHLCPDGLHKNPAFSQVVVSEGPVRTVYVGGQNAVTQAGEIVGKGDVGAQTEQVFDNLERALAAAGGGLENIVKWTILVVGDGGPAGMAAFEAFRRRWGDRGAPPAITLAYVRALANPDFLIEIDAVALIPIG